VAALLGLPQNQVPNLRLKWDRLHRGPHDELLASCPKMPSDLEAKVGYHVDTKDPAKKERVFGYVHQKTTAINPQLGLELPLGTSTYPANAHEGTHFIEHRAALALAVLPGQVQLGDAAYDVTANYLWIRQQDGLAVFDYNPRREDLPIRYTARGAVSLERLEVDANGDLLYTFTRPWSDGTTGIKLSPLELLEKLAALVPLPRLHLVRYGGCLAPHSRLRRLITPTPRQQGLDTSETQSASPYWSWARLLKRVFAFDMQRCPACGRGTLRIIAAITHADVIRKILRHLKLAAEPPPIAPARVCHTTLAWASP
jgi:hypothetical protein